MIPRIAKRMGFCDGGNSPKILLFIGIIAVLAVTLFTIGHRHKATYDA